LIFSSLFVRLMLAFGLVIFIAVAIIFIIVNQTTTNEFRAYMFQGQMTQLDQIARELAAYYAARGNWQGVDRYVAQALGQMPGGMMMGGGMPMMGAALSLADANGVIVASRDGLSVGQMMSPAQLANGVAIRVDGKTVGTLIAPNQFGATGFDLQQQEFLQRVNLSLLIAGLVAGVIALLAGFVLFAQITAPLNALTTASRKIAAGDLTARVAHPPDNEIGQVGRAFNAMTDSLAQSENARRNMIADIAHELRNPLGIVQGQLEGMIDGVFPVTPEQIASLHDETRLLTRLVDDLHELALADAGQLNITRAPVDLKGLIARTIDTLMPQALENEIALRTVIVDGLPIVNIDAQRIEQVLRNLIGNALRYTPADGAIQVECSVRAKSFVVRVQDTGQGIAAEDLPHVFERFYRGDKARSRGAGGAGLGLAIAQQIIAAHGGTIGVESEFGKGATFWFTLPI